MLLLSDGRTRLDIGLEAPEGWNTDADVIELTVADLSTLIDTCGQINKPDYRLSATGSDTVPDQPLCEEGNATAFGASNFEGTITVLRQYDTDEQIDPAKDTVFAAIGEKGVEAYYYEREGKKAKAPYAVGDEGFIYKALSDEPQKPSDRAGYIKHTIPLGVQARRRFKIVAPSGG